MADRAYRVYEVEVATDGRRLRELGEVQAPSAHEAIARAVGAGARSDRYAAVAERNWVEVEVERRVTTQLRIGGRVVELPGEGERSGP